ncbi:MAG: ATP-binding protein [Proteobacteria bacterium]|nr:ATP-binding protein [Pseudomonadota bacterium]
MDKFFEQAPKIIAVAAKSPRGIVALIILALSALAFVYFVEAPVWVKVGIFIILVLGFGLIAFYVMRQTPEARRGDKEPVPPNEKEPITTPALDKDEAPQAEAVEKPEPEEWRPILADNISIAKLPPTGEHLFGREQELERLDGAWADAETNVISLVAWGGVGKSALVNHWLGQMGKEHYRGATRVLGWSFFSQGTRETEASADEFIAKALEWFGDADPTKGSPWDKGERLAGLVKQEPTLLILDGLEPLQNPPGADEGRLKDPTLAVLVRELAAANPGLCVITTRHRVADIEHYSGSTAPLIVLEDLSDEAGAALLGILGVEGPEEELQQASREFGGHALALNLLGTFLRDVCDGDVRRWNEVSLLEEDAEKGGQARRVMASYEKWLGEGPELAVLRLIGLFDRPADGGAIAALREPPAIPGLTDSLENLGERKWKQALAKLRRARLLAEVEPHDPDTLDAHPLVREYFGKKLKAEQPAGWKEAHNRLYEYCKSVPDKEFPETIEEMAPLFAAVAHGCQAGRHQEALDGVFRRRIQRGEEAFNTAKLGAISAELAAFASFFDPPWHRPAAGLAEHDKGFILSEAGFDLRALGRLTEAVQPMQASLKAATAQENWTNAARATGNLSELYLIMGDLAQALEFGRKAADFANRSRDVFLQLAERTTFADALHQTGRIEEAKALFSKAEAMQKERQPEFPLLYSLQGFRYCEMLLDQGKYREVQDRARQTLNWLKQAGGVSLLDIALNHLSLGHAHLLEAQQAGSEDFTQATEHLGDAVDGLRKAGTQHHIPRGLLARAALHRVTGAHQKTQRHLDEAMSIATRGGMGLHQADTHLEYARLYLAMDDKAKAREHLATAQEMIERMGYHRRDGKLAELEEQLGEQL